MGLIELPRVIYNDTTQFPDGFDPWGHGMQVYERRPL